MLPNEELGMEQMRNRICSVHSFSNLYFCILDMAKYNECAREWTRKYAM
jgi:hypothetical protein